MILYRSKCGRCGYRVETMSKTRLRLAKLVHDLRHRRVDRTTLRAGVPLPRDRCEAYVEDAIAGTWSCRCGAREGDRCPLEVDE